MPELFLVAFGLIFLVLAAWLLVTLGGIRRDVKNIYSDFFDHLNTLTREVKKLRIAMQTKESVEEEAD